ncbi:hypothetical protein BU16DRAFT_565166 [Lophium mytilinum]|uniref:Uncharacterized protein n=1 Tax=Lophium mytilinum TaxID=390894 RepID=A0A6A6QJ41_9PEZI|nr:hypothetical protein BU16DRAFT_565166 [Lophium mytilinum]
MAPRLNLNPPKFEPTKSVTLERLQAYGIVPMDEIDLADELHPLLQASCFQIPIEAYENMSPGLQLLSKLLTYDAPVRSYVTNMLTNAAQYQTSKDSKAMGKTPLDTQSLNTWIDGYFSKHKDPKMRRLYLDPVAVTPERITRTRKRLKQLARYVKFRPMPPPKTDKDKLKASNVLGDRPIGFADIPYIAVIRIHSSIIDYFKNPDIAASPSLYRRSCFLLAVSLGHEIAHAINFLRFSGSTQGKHLEDKKHIFHSIDDLEAEEGRAWEMSTFGHVIEALPGTNDDDDIIPYYGLSAQNWKDYVGGRSYVISAIPMAYVDHFFQERTWNEIAESGEIPVLDLTSTLQVRATRIPGFKKEYTYKLLPVPDLPEAKEGISTAQTTRSTQKDRTPKAETEEEKIAPKNKRKRNSDSPVAAISTRKRTQDGTLDPAGDGSPPKKKQKMGTPKVRRSARLQNSSNQSSPPPSEMDLDNAAGTANASTVEEPRKRMIARATRPRK